MQAGLERDAGLEAQRAPCGRQHLVELGGTLLGNLFERRSARTTQQAVNAWFSYLASPFAQDPKPVRLLPAGAVAGWGLHPLESAALSRRTPMADIRRCNPPSV